LDANPAERYENDDDDDEVEAVVNCDDEPRSDEVDDDGRRLTLLVFEALELRRSWYSYMYAACGRAGGAARRGGEPVRPVAEGIAAGRGGRCGTGGGILDMGGGRGCSRRKMYSAARTGLL